LEYTKALNYEKNANLNLFSDINQNNRSVGLSAPVLHRRAFYNPPLRSNNTTQETDKPRLIKEHIGATNTTNFPTTRIGQEQLRQKALMNITELPSIMKSLIDSVKDLKQINNNNDNNEVPEVVQSSDAIPEVVQSNDFVPEVVQSNDFMPPVTQSAFGTADDLSNTEDFQDSTQQIDIEKFNNELKELERISSRLRRSGGISERTITKLIDWDVITRDMSSNSGLILERIDEYSELIKAEIAEMSGA
jgi:hypothetical protein